VTGAEAVPFAAAPQIVFKVRVTNTPADEQIHAVALRCQVRIEPAERAYTPDDRARLIELFGEPSRWGQTLRSMLWTHAAALVPPFAESADVDLSVPCTLDFNLAATKYFYGLDDGDVSLVFLFSGTVFYETADGLRVAQIPWDREAKYRMPVAVWRRMMDHYHPGTAWLCLRRDVFDRLYRYKTGRGLPTWEQALEDLLRAEDEP
jgi:hypothetical protein